MKRNIRVYFSDFWDNFLMDDNYFYNLLSTKYNLIIDEVNPEILIYSLFGNNHHKYDRSRCIKIFYTGENRRPNYDECDYSLSFDYTDDNRNYRLPLWALILNWFDRPYNMNRDHAYLQNIDDFLNKKIPTKNKFCAFVVSNPSAQKRIEFAYKLSVYKRIDSPGRVLNNMPMISGRGDQIEKINFLKDYKFNLCFENSSNPGYCTEKIIHAMFMSSIPIYYGDPLVVNDFNVKSFLNWHDYNNDELLLSKIIEIDNNDKLYRDMINEPWFNDNKIPDYILPENVLSFFEKIINK
jgi:hypothetical protein